MQYAIYFLIGAVVNRIRGGLINVVTGKDNPSPNKYLNYLLNGGKVFNDVSFGLCSSFIRTGGFNLEIFLWFSLAMYAGRSLGWGNYIGAMINKAVPADGEVSFIDSKIEHYKSTPVKWGWAGLSMRGAVWGLTIGLVSHSFLPVLAGLTMGSVYWLMIQLAGKISNRGAGWGYGEYLFGGILWMASL